MRRLLLFAMTALLLRTAGAQAQKAPARSRTLPRMADGHPDLQGVYDLATITPLERPSGAPAAYTKEQARKLETAAALLKEKGDESIQGERKAPPKGGDGSVGAAGNVGG